MTDPKQWADEPPNLPPPPEPSSLPLPGWYPDPSGQSTRRFWDGSAWTSHTGEPPPLRAVKKPTVMTQAGTVLLAGWWRRFGGYVLDLIIVEVAIAIVLKIIEKIDVALRAPLSPGLHPPTPGAQVAEVVANVAIVVGYSFVLLRFQGQTVGMMATGVRAVDRSSGAALNTPQTWRRVLTFFMIVILWEQIAFVIRTNSVTGPTPIAASIFIAIALIGLVTTALWPTGSTLNQTLQDKAAGTIVIRTRH
jgi:uncharacterized RDD family membrane protein YckC